MEKPQVAIESQNHIEGLQGWALYKDGTLKVYHDGVLRVHAKNLEMPAKEKAGELVYDLRIDTSGAVFDLEKFGDVISAATIKNAKISESLPSMSRKQFLIQCTLAAVEAGKDPDYAADCAVRAAKTLSLDQE